MLAGLYAFNSTFLLDLSNTESRISRANQQIGSGFRVNTASDAPTDIGTILNYQNQVSQTMQVQKNLNLAKTNALGADNALTTASSFLTQLTSLAAQGASSTTTAATRATLGQQVQGIAQQLVNLANTSVQGHYIFGGGDPATQPYTFNWSVPGGASQNNIAVATNTIQDITGQTIVPSMTAQQIFDSQNADGTPAPGNIFQAVYALGQSLQTNDQTGILAAVDSLKAASTQLGTATASYGNVENWIQNALDSTSTSLTSLKAEVSSLRDTDVVAAATEMTTAQTAMQAAVAARGSLNVKTLFDYMG